MTNLPPDATARAEALDPARSFIVEAPAGSGKTGLLMQRYLSLLAVVDRPESIVAMTFTRKAAAEMRVRILEALEHAREETPCVDEHSRVTRQLALAALRRDQEKGWKLQENSRCLQIQTIDSLCALLTSQMPWLSRFGSNPRVLEHAEELYRQAARRTLAALPEANQALQEAFEVICLHFDNDLRRVEALLADMLEKRDQWLRAFHTVDLLALRERLEQSLCEEIEVTLRHAYEQCPETVSADIAGWARQMKAANLCRNLQSLPGPAITNAQHWRELRTLFLTTDGLVRKKPSGLAKADVEAFTETLSALPDFVKALDACGDLPPERLTDEQWNIILHFVVLLRLSVAQLYDVFRERHEVDFSEITEAAIYALGTDITPTNLAFRFDYRIEHILVDEFQDTSLAQFELLERLTAQWSADDNRTLFLVGDPMQSIYRFRNAEVGLFLRAKKSGIGSVRLTSLQLTANFRSTEAVVNWLNRSFQEIMPRADDAESGAVSFRPCQSMQNDDGPAPQVHAFIQDGSVSKETSRAVDLAVSALQEGTVGILVRSRTHLLGILRLLKDRRVPYQAIEIDALQSEQHVIDILTLTRAILHLGDRIAWLACLRAPWCGLILNDLAAIAENDSTRTIRELLHDPERIGQISSEGRQRAERTSSVLEAARANLGHLPLRHIVESAWLSLGGPVGFTTNQWEDAQTVFSLLEDHDEGGTIRDFSLLAARLENLFARPTANVENAVQLLTVHGAKGLEFDTVILPQLDKKSGFDDQELLIWTEKPQPHGGVSLIMAALPQRGTADRLYDFVKNQRDKKERNERSRLLYVAATRTRKHLHLLCTLTPSANGDIKKAPRDTFLGMLWLAIEGELRVAAESAVTGEQVPAKAETIVRRLPLHWKLPEPAPSVAWQSRPTEEIATQRLITYEWVKDTARHAGTVVHDLLRLFAEQGLAQWSEQRIESSTPFIRSELLRLGVSRSEVETATARVVKALTTTLTSERGQWILADHEEARSEWALGGAEADVFRSINIDRTFVSEGVRWIIDFKTSEHLGGSLEDFLEEEQRRYSEQLETYARLLQRVEKRPIKVGLYFPLFDAWKEWQTAETVSAVS